MASETFHSLIAIKGQSGANLLKLLPASSLHCAFCGSCKTTAKLMEVITVSTNLNTRVNDNTVDRSGCLVWHRLQSEREGICEALLKEPVPALGSEAATQWISKETL